MCTLNKILPGKLCKKAGLPRKTAHCLRITCASKLFQNSFEDKLTRERTGHRSNTLFRDQKASENQLDNVSEVLAPCINSRKSSVRNTRVTNKSAASKAEVENGCAKDNDESNNCINSSSSLLDGLDGLFDEPDEVLAKMSMPKIE